MSNIEKMAEMLHNNPELQDRIEAEMERLAGANETADGMDALAMAVKAVLGIDLSGEDVETLAAESGVLDSNAESRELSLDELETLSGGKKYHTGGTVRFGLEVLTWLKAHGIG